MIFFPDRVWEQVGCSDTSENRLIKWRPSEFSSWSSCTATKKDYDRRILVIELIRSETPAARKEQIKKILDKASE